MLLGEDGRQTYTAKVPHTPHLPEAARKLLESYLRLADWNQLLRVEEDIAKTQLGNLTRNSRMTGQTVHNDSSIRTDAAADYRPAP